MNLNFTSFPFIEKFIVYGGIFFSSVVIILLSSLLHIEKTGRKISILLYYITLIFIFFSNIFLFFYIKFPFETIAGIEINRIYLFLLIIVIVCFLLMFNKFEKVEDYIPALISIIAIQLIFLSPSFIIIFIAFIVFESAFSYILNQIKLHKFFYILMSLIFIGFFLLFDKVKIQSISINGGLVFLLLSTFAARTIDSTHNFAKEDDKYRNYVFFPLVISMIVFFKIIEIFNSSSIVFYPIFISSFILLVLSIYNLLTEEDINNFFIFDFANILFLSLLTFSVIKIEKVDILVIVFVMLLIVLFLHSFFINSTNKYTVSYVRYNINKIKNAGTLFLGVVFTLFVEIYLIYIIINNFIFFNPYIQTIFLIAGFIYVINILNKIFIIISMISRIKIDNLKYILFNKIIIRPILFIGLIISMIFWWLKNG